MVVMMGGMGWMMRRAGSRGPGSSENPVEVLKVRDARGELTQAWLLGAAQRSGGAAG